MSLVFSSTKKQKNVKTVSACTESIVPIKKNIHLVTQSLQYFSEVKMSGPKEILTHAQRVCRLYKVSFLDFTFRVLLIEKGR